MAIEIGTPIRFVGIHKSFGDLNALEPLDLHVEAGEFLTLLGPSGSGKTTILNIAAGYTLPDGGTLQFGSRDVTRLAPRHRNIGMMFQSYALFPHMNVFENIAYGLRVRRCPNADIERKVLSVLDMVRLDGLERRSIDQLSGGQQQRVALARAMVIEPDLLLMDEPLAALDRQLRKHVEVEIRRLHVSRRRTTIYVTHDQEEALVMSDRIAVLNAGRIEQVGTPLELYASPRNVFVATFLGESNLIPGVVTARREQGDEIKLDGLDELMLVPTKSRSAVDKIYLLARPESITVSDPPNCGLVAEVIETLYLGEMTSVRLRLQNGHSISMRRMGSQRLRVGETLHLSLDFGSLRVLDREGAQQWREKDYG
ncbi:MAG: polyamine ABC transporter ATP-binding protein [Stutzerimonas stutzeri]|jgi:ABC-type Fe3+/spermidine/putrescine transport system ATPase subunit|nr:MAG: polyamine ABC transporter ATP-binding protein [Stutzerimonas stutzeri]